MLEFKRLDDERLIEAFREGSSVAATVLLDRYLEHQQAFTMKAIPEYYSYLKDWDLNAIFFGSFQIALMRYNFRFKFSTLFAACLRNAAKRAYREVVDAQGGTIRKVASLDEHVYRCEEAPAIIDMTADRSYRSDVVAQASDDKLLDDIQSLPIDKFDPYTYSVALGLIQGYRVAEIARDNGIDRKRVERIIEKLKQYLWSRIDLQVRDRYKYR